MATTIVTKNGSGAPAASDLVAGELAVDLTNGRLYTEDSGGSVIEIGLNPSGNVDVTGSVTADSFEVDDTDDIRLRFLNASTFKGGLQIATTAGDMIATSAVDDLAIRSQTNMLFATGGNTEAMRISSAGSVGIGTTSPAFGLSVEKDNGSGYVALFRKSSSDPALTIQTTVAGITQIQGLNAGLSAVNDIAMQTSGGNVGIGNSSPSTGIDVTNTNYTYSGTTYDIYGIIGLTSGGVRLGGDSSNSDSVIGTTGTGDMQFVTYNGSAWGSRMTLDNTGNVGIGTDNPVVTLDVYGAMAVSNSTTSYWSFDRDNTTGALEIKDTGSDQFVLTTGGKLTIGVGGNAAGDVLELANGGYSTKVTHDSDKSLIHGNSASRDLAFGANNAEAFRVDTSGNLLVGKTTTAIETVGINLFGTGRILATADGDDVVVLNRKNSDGDIAVFKKDSSTTVGSIGTEGGDMAIGNDDAGIQFVNGTEHFRPFNMTTNAATDALMDIGSSSKRFKDLYLSGVMAAGNGSATAPSVRGTDTNTGLFFPSGGITAISRNGVEAARFDASGTLLVGKSSGAVSDNGHQIFATGQHYYYSTATEVQRFYETTTQNQVGSISITTSATAYNTSSDQRLKENIADANDAGSKIDAIQVRKFDWIADGSHQDYGMVAQELQTVAPEAVSAPEDPEKMMGVDYSKLVPMLVKEIQSLRARVAQLES